jgi:hypothetical protein
MSEEQTKEDLINMPEEEKFNLIKNIFDNLIKLQEIDNFDALKEIQKIKEQFANNNRKLQIFNKIYKKAKMEIENGTLKEEFFYRAVNTIVKANFSDKELNYLELFANASNKTRIDTDADTVYINFYFVLSYQRLLNFANIKITYLPNFKMTILYPHIDSTIELLKDLYNIILEFEQLLKP